MEGSTTKELGWLWKIIAGPRVKFFWWQLLWEKLLVHSKLVKRGRNVYDICFACREVSGIALHVLITLSIASDCWR